jgi:hypothetical protein
MILKVPIRFLSKLKGETGINKDKELRKLREDAKVN